LYNVSFEKTGKGSIMTRLVPFITMNNGTAKVVGSAFPQQSLPFPHIETEQITEGVNTNKEVITTGD
jgi:hypothetical protein